MLKLHLKCDPFRRPDACPRQASPEAASEGKILDVPRAGMGTLKAYTINFEA